MCSPRPICSMCSHQTRPRQVVCPTIRPSKSSQELRVPPRPDPTLRTIRFGPMKLAGYPGVYAAGWSANARRSAWLVLDYIALLAPVPQCELVEYDRRGARRQRGASDRLERSAPTRIVRQPDARGVRSAVPGARLRSKGSRDIGAAWGSYEAGPEQFRRKQGFETNPAE